MKRLIYSKLIDWKNKVHRKPLILLGARQVGKTYILRQFGKNEFSNTIYLNCHKDEYVETLFSDSNAVRIVKELERIYEQKIVPGETLLIFDEIQEVVGGISSLKYFYEDCPELHIVVAGSLLGISLHEGESYPVGKVETLRMYPMTFSEYLLARRGERLVESVESLDWASMKLFHAQLEEHLREYFFVGGMPEAVQEFVTTQNVHQVRAIQNEILNAYKYDIGKHTKTQAQRIRMVWDSIPSQLARENKKFIFGAIKKGARAVDYEIALQWLVDAGLILKVDRMKSLGNPISFYADKSAFKVYMLDCGLLSCMCRASSSELLVGNSAFVEYKGALAENFVLQQLEATLDTADIYYFAKDNSTQEVDFIVQTEKRIIPMEVKAEVNVKSKSLSGFINTDHIDKQLKGLRISMKPYIDQGWMENIPLFAAEAFIRKECKKLP